MARYPIIFGPYLLLERINVGGMAEVFRAKVFGIEGFERIVAVKRILPSLADDQAFIKMFIDEARIASQVSHQNVVQIYDLGRHDGQYFMAMEYVSGRDLRQILDLQRSRGELMPIPRACHIISKVCEGLEYAHNKRGPAGNPLNIIHRDVTPQNIMCSYEGEVKLCDFGIAKAATRAAKKTKVGVLKGKFAYMSPEQVMSREVDHRSDLFALGVVLYEMLTGERLFLTKSDYGTLSAVRNAKVAPLRPKNPKISVALERVVLRILARDPKDRFQSAAELQEALSEHLVEDGRLFLPRQLRQWMQETYSEELEAESVKLEAFMQVKRPPGLRTESDLAPARSPLNEAVADDPTEGPVLGGAAASVVFDPSTQETPDISDVGLAPRPPDPLTETQCDPEFAPAEDEGDMTLLEDDAGATLEGSASDIQRELQEAQLALRSELEPVADDTEDELEESVTEGVLDAAPLPAPEALTETPSPALPTPSPASASQAGLTRTPTPNPTDTQRWGRAALWESVVVPREKMSRLIRASGGSDASLGPRLLIGLGVVLAGLLSLLLGLWLLRAPVAALELRVQTPGPAEVWVDEELVATELPAKLLNLPLGAHSIRVEGEGLLPRVEILDLGSSGTYILEIEEAPDE